MIHQPDSRALELDTVLTSPRFAEHHHRIVPLPIDDVWPACQRVSGEEIRLLGPLMKLRNVPRLLQGRKALVVDQKSDLDEGAATADEPEPLIDAFLAEGFHLLRSDPAPIEGRAVILFGAVGKFWSPAGNGPVRFASTEEFLSFEDPGYAKMVATLAAVDLGDGTTRVETSTLVRGTDRAGTVKFAPYWTIIRGPSGLIRRSWMAAIERRARKGGAR